MDAHVKNVTEDEGVSKVLTMQLVKKKKEEEVKTMTD